MTFEETLEQVVRRAVRDELAKGQPAANAQSVFDPLQLLTTEQVGELIRYTPEGVRGLITSGKLQGMMTGAGWRVKRAWLEEWMAKQLGDGVAAADPDEEARRDVVEMQKQRGRK